MNSENKPATVKTAKLNKCGLATAKIFDDHHITFSHFRQGCFTKWNVWNRLGVQIAFNCSTAEASAIAHGIQLLSSEHAALCAVAEAAYLAVADRWVNEAITTGRADTQGWVRDLRSALANLEAVRKGK